MHSKIFKWVKNVRNILAIVLAHHVESEVESKGSVKKRTLLPEDPSWPCIFVEELDIVVGCLTTSLPNIIFER